MSKKLTIISFIFIFIISNYVYAGEKQEDLSADYSIQDIQAPQLEGYFSMIESFNSKEGILYPDTYGGAFFDENENLTIVITKNDDSIKDYYRKLTGLKNLGFIVHENSYDELYNNYLTTIEDLKNLTKLENKESSVKIDIIEGDIDVEIYNMNYIDLNTVKNSFRASSMIDVSEMKTNNNFLADLDPGHEVNDSSTVGFGATKDGKDGFIMAAHVCSSNQQITFKDTTSVCGVVKDRDLNSWYDAAWVEASSSYTPTNEIRNGKDITAYTTVDLPIGTWVSFYGKESYTLSGEIDSNDWAGMVGATYFVDLIEVDFGNDCAVNGDSGGPLYRNLYGSSVALMGICTAGDGDTTKFSKLEYMITFMDFDVMTN